MKPFSALAVFYFANVIYQCALQDTLLENDSAFPSALTNSDAPDKTVLLKSNCDGHCPVNAPDFNNPLDSRCLLNPGYCHYSASDMTMATESSAAFQDFIAELDNLQPDPYITHIARYRVFANIIFDTATDRLTMLPSREYTQYTPWEDRYKIRAGRRTFPGYSPKALPFLYQYLRAMLAQFTPLHPDTRYWLLKPNLVMLVFDEHHNSTSTPEGIHTDGNTYQAITAIRRHNVRGGRLVVFPWLDRLHGVQPEEVMDEITTGLLFTEPLETILFRDDWFLHAALPFGTALPGDKGYRANLQTDFLKMVEKACHWCEVDRLRPSARPPSNLVDGLIQRPSGMEPVWSRPLAVTDDSLVVEGSEFWFAAQQLGLKRLPCTFVQSSSLYVFRNRFSPFYRGEYDQVDTVQFLDTLQKGEFYPWDTVFLHSTDDQVMTNCTLTALL